MAAQRSTNVPKFDNFDEENVPYRSYFDTVLSGSFKSGSDSSHNKSPAHHRKRSDFKGNSSDDNSHSRGTTSVPKFGDWDMNTGYTVIFNKVKEEKQSASSVLPDVPQPEIVSEPRREKHRRNRSPSKMRCCFF